MSTLKSLYEAEGPDFLDRLHAATKANRKYLYQIAVGIRRPSAGLARRLAAADPRMTLTELLFPEDCIAAAQHPPQTAQGEGHA